MAFKLLLIIAVYCASHLLAIPVVEEVPIFRNDYTYIPSVKLFLKEHKTPQKWSDAMVQCSAEGATLMYPKSEAEARAALQFKDNNTHALWLGIHDMFLKGQFITLAGEFVSKSFIKWKPGEPNNVNDNERCLVVGGTGLANDIDCEHRFKYICAKESTNITKNPACGTYDMKYVYNHEADRCYKLHTDPRNWRNAFRICKAEQSQLAIINSEDEAKIFVDMIAKHSMDNLRGTFDNVYLAFNNIFTNDDFMTVNGETLQDAGYNTWSNGKFDNKNKTERCGAMFRDGKLNDLNCENKAVFICEKDLTYFSETPSL